ncbi:hypothetical protein BH09PLA1_BH09PLA1_07990 [soil metagenome]
METRNHKSAFTIVELMVSIGLVLILMLGVSQVFKTISSTVSAGSAISDNTRLARGAQAVFAQDIGSMVVRDAPCIILHSEVRPAFRNRTDLAGDRDYLATGSPNARDQATRTTDINGDNQETDVASPGRPNYRMHRIDSFSFFTRGLFKRQTGGSVATAGTSPFIADMTSSEAWVWYGHLRIANNDGSVLVGQDPGAGTLNGLGANHNNFLSTQWVLGREAMVLRELENGAINDRNGTPQIYISGGGGLSPLSYGTGDMPVGTFTIQQSRYDLAATSISSYRQTLLNYISANPNATWWQDIFGSGGRRFQANPAITKPITAASLSQQAPIFIPGCTQFIVEYAGDFVSQVDNPALPTYGNVVGWFGAANPSTDDNVDFVVVNGAKRVRWYGAPRDTSGDGLVPGWIAGRLSNQMPDVVPLRDVIRTIPGEQASNGAPFEKLMATKMPPLADYTAMALASEYECGWGPNDRKPKMIRITIVIDDPSGRNPNPDGQTFEYVFELP